MVRFRRLCVVIGNGGARPLGLTLGQTRGDQKGQARWVKCFFLFTLTFLSALRLYRGKSESTHTKGQTMNPLHKFSFWRSQPCEASTAQSVLNGAESVDVLANLVHLPVGSPLDEPAGLASPLRVPSVISSTALPQGLMDSPELKGFFAGNHFGLGRHNGALYQTQEALALGRETLVAKFQNVIEIMVAQRLGRVDALRNMALQTAGVCTTVTAQLNLACQRLERDMATLQVQSEQAAEHKGWVLSALNEYQIGFGKGLREAVDFALLGQQN